MKGYFSDFPLCHWHTTSVTAMTTSTSWSGYSERKYLLVENDSDIAVYMAFSTVYGSTTATAEAQKGIRLNANGGSWESSRGLGNLYQGPLGFLSTAATKLVLITEAW